MVKIALGKEAEFWPQFVLAPTLAEKLSLLSRVPSSGYMEMKYINK